MDRHVKSPLLCWLLAHLWPMTQRAVFGSQPALKYSHTTTSLANRPIPLLTRALQANPQALLLYVLGYGYLVAGNSSRHYSAGSCQSIVNHLPRTERCRLEGLGRTVGK